MANTRVFKYQQLFQSTSAMPAALRAFTGNKIRTCPRDAPQATVKGRSKLRSPRFLNISSHKRCPYPQKWMFSQGASNSRPYQTTNGVNPTPKDPSVPTTLSHSSQGCLGSTVGSMQHGLHKLPVGLAAPFDSTGLTLLSN